MRAASSEFADDPCSSVKRGTMVRAARALLSAVTRLLILADMADVMRLLAHLKIVRSSRSRGIHTKSRHTVGFHLRAGTIVRGIHQMVPARMN